MVLCTRTFRNYRWPRRQLGAHDSFHGDPTLKWQGIDSSLQEIWIRFDLFGTGFIELQQLQFLMSIVLYNIPELCRTGEVVENATANAHNTDSLILSGEPVR